MNIFETNAPPAGARASEAAHRKIELQSPADLAYLVANVQRAARDKVDRHLPADLGGDDSEDGIRRRIESLVDAYVKDTFGLAKDSLMINGMDHGETEAELAKVQDGEDFEAFDAGLAQRIQALSAQIEGQTLQLANLRRNAPAETAKRFQNAFRQQSEEFDTMLRLADEEKVAKAKDTVLNVGEVERLENVQGNWRQSAEELNALKSGMGSSLAKMERAQRAVEYVKSSA